jgi:hypothetical protein
MSKEFQIKTGNEVFTMITGEGTPRKLATATRPQFSINVADFKVMKFYSMINRVTSEQMSKVSEIVSVSIVR